MSSASGNKLHAEKYEQLILRRGRIVKWREAITCSCWNLDSGQADYGCQACKGVGYVYEDPIEDIVLVQSVTHNKEFADMAGVFEVGDAIMSVGKRVPWRDPVTGAIDTTMVKARENRLFHVGMHDLITLTDDVYKTSEILTKDTPMYARPADTLLNEDVTAIVKVRKWNKVTGLRTDYVEGTHFTRVDNQLIWDTGTGIPEEGEQYSVVYEHRPTFTIYSHLPTPRHQDNQDLPRRVAIRYLAGGLHQR